MNILHLSAVKNWGGGENHLENLCLELKQQAPEVNNIILCNATGIFRKKLENSGINFVPGRLSFKMDPRYLLKLITLCRKEKIDLIHIHDTTALTLAVMGDHFYNLPPFVLSKKTSFPIKSRKQTLFKYNYPKIKKILCVSNATKVITGKSVKDKEKLINIYHGTNISLIGKNTAVNLRQQLNLSKGIRIIGNIANHIRSKNLRTFIKVAEELIYVKKVKDLHFVQIGAFTRKTQELMDLVKKKNLEKHISFLGHVPDAAGIIPQFEISLLTSQSEGMPQFIYESLYHQIPVVSTNVGGISEVIDHKFNGLLAPEHDYKRLAKHLNDLLNDAELKTKLTQTSKEKIESNFTTKIMAAKTLEVYKSLQNGRYQTGN